MRNKLSRLRSTSALVKIDIKAINRLNCQMMYLRYLINADRTIDLLLFNMNVKDWDDDIIRNIAQNVSLD